MGPGKNNGISKGFYIFDYLFMLRQVMVKVQNSSKGYDEGLIK